MCITVCVCGIAFCCKIPCIQSSSIAQNILSSHVYNKVHPDKPGTDFLYRLTVSLI